MNKKKSYIYDIQTCFSLEYIIFFYCHQFLKTLLSWNKTKVNVKIIYIYIYACTTWQDLFYYSFIRDTLMSMHKIETL